MKPLDKALLDKLYQQHLAGDMISDIARENSIRPATLYYALKRIGPVTRGFMKSQGDLSKVFPVVTPEAAYIYGLWLADGCYYRKKWSIKLQASDKLLLNTVREYLGANRLYPEVNSYNLMINVDYNKSLDENWFPRQKSEQGISFPKLPTELYSHFIRGYFDGNGSISIRKERPNQVQLYLCSVDKSFLVAMQGYLLEEGIEGIVHSENRDHLGFKTMYTLRLGTHQARFQFFEYLYANCGIFFLERKFQAYQVYVNTVLRSGISIRPRDSVTHSS